MFFNSIEFVFFLPIVFFIYWMLGRKNLIFQNFLLFFSSCFFYACWDWRFLFLLMFSILLDYFSGIKIFEASGKREKYIWLSLSIVINLGFLFCFKYYNFFVSSFASALNQIGLKANISSLQLILPVGISFYTFHGLSYIIDIYNERVYPERNFINYAVFVSFFPLLVAGPIERATHLLPQVVKKREFNYAKAVDGLRQILWGLFKKIVIADNCAEIANLAFNNTSEYFGIFLILGAIFFAFQIYGDFSGYSDIAIGVSRLLGFNLIKNFNYPYFSRNIAEFWRRWHISLSSWFRDYLYIPLGGSKVNTLKKIRNTFIIFIVSGFWHGANWTFIIWGLLNALYFIPSLLAKKNRIYLDVVAKGRTFPTIKEFSAILLTFGLTVFAWIFFRAANIPHAIFYIKKMLSGLELQSGYLKVFDLFNEKFGFSIVFIILIFFSIEWKGRENEYAISNLGLKWPSSVRYLIYLLITTSLFWYGGANQQFIYFQF